MTTHQPLAPYSPDELTTLYPPQLRLQLVQILMRHGERTPINARFRSAGLPTFWPYCNAARHLRSAILNPDSKSFSTLEWKHRLETFGPEDAPIIAAGPKGELDAICDFGMLTDRGRETTYQLGKRLRHLYVDQLAFLPSNITNSDFIYLRATPVPRALESMQQAFQGLYPSGTRAPEFPPPIIISRSPADETLFPNDASCRRFAALSRAFAQRAAERWNGSEEMDYATKKIGKWMPEDSPRVAVDSHPRLSGIMDTINATDAHGPATKLPREFYDPKLREIIDKVGVEEWYQGYKESNEYRTLGIGGLLGDLVARMVGSVEHSTADGEYELAQKVGVDGAVPVQFGLSGCHDTTLGGVLASLGAFENEKWPPFTSHIAVELFRDANVPAAAPPAPTPSQSWFSSIFSWGGAKLPAGAPPPGIGRKRTPDLSEVEKSRLDGYYVRLRYNDRPMTIPGCKALGKHLEGDESFCTLVSLPVSNP